MQAQHTGTVTVLTALTLSVGCKAVDRDTGFLSKSVCPAFGQAPLSMHGHMTAAQRLQNLKPGTARPFMFTFVRDPWSRVLTCAAWNGVVGGPRKTNFTRAESVQRFRQWARENFGHDGQWGACRYMKSMTHYTFVNGRLAVDFAGDVSRLRDDFHRVCHDLRLPQCLDVDQVPRHCISSCPGNGGNKDDTPPEQYARLHENALSVRDAYDEQTVQLVARAWASDVRNFNFTFAAAAGLR